MRPLGEHVLRRLRRGSTTTPAETRLAELEAEVVLLREENARLAIERLRTGSPGHAVEQLRAVAEHVSSASSAADDAWEQLAEARVTRELLLGVCIELERLGASLREQLEAGPTPTPVAVPGDYALALTAQPLMPSSATEGV